MLSRFPIAREDYRKGIVGINDVHTVEILHLWDMRSTLAQVMDAPEERVLIVRAIRRDILGKPD
jgi:hypothetical protein